MFYAFMSLVWPVSVPQAFFLRQTGCYLIWKVSDLSELYVSVFLLDLSKKTRARNS